MRKLRPGEWSSSAQGPITVWSSDSDPRPLMPWPPYHVLVQGVQTLSELTHENPAGTGQALWQRVPSIICRNLHQIDKWHNRWRHSRTPPKTFPRVFQVQLWETRLNPTLQTLRSSSTWCLVCQVLVSSASRAVITTSNLYHPLQQHKESMELNFHGISLSCPSKFSGKERGTDAKYRLWI